MNYKKVYRSKNNFYYSVFMPYWIAGFYKREPLFVNLYSFIAIVLLLATSCNNIQPEEPAFVPFDEAPVTKGSRINIPITFEVKHLERKINTVLSGEFYSDDSFETDSENLKITLSTYKRTKIKLKGNKMVTIIPLNVVSEVQLEKKVLGINIRKRQKLNFKVDLEFESEYGINHDWQIITKTHLKDLHWKEEPKVKVAFLNIKVTKIVEKILKEKEKHLLSKIDKEIKDNIHIEKIIAKIWKDIQKPILVNRQVKNVWLKLDPHAVTTSPIYSDGKYIIINTSIDGQLHSIIDDSVSAFTVKEIPKLKILKTLQDEFDLNVKSEVLFSEINRLLADSLEGKILEVSGHKIKVKNAHMKGNGKNLILKLDVGGDTKGTLYFTGKPVFDPEKQALTITDFNFDVNTEEIIVKVADWLYHDEFRDKIQKVLYLPLGDKLRQIPLLIENAVAKGKMGQKIDLSIYRMIVVPEDIVIRPEGIHITLNAKGKVGLFLEKI
jgi:hypothetical protein